VAVPPLAPAGVKKDGAAFDLPIAIGILAASEQVKEGRWADTLFAGELVLVDDGPSVRNQHII
jgi:magnesium chelatase family protein